MTEHPEASADDLKDKIDQKLPFSIDNLLADKFVKEDSVQPSTSDCFMREDTSSIHLESDEDKDSSGSELDVESSVAGDVQDLTDNKLSEYQPGCSSRGKRARTAFSAQQIKSLEAEFERNRYLSVAARGRLARTLRLTETQIKIWFQNRRTKWKRKYTNDVEILAQQYYTSLGIVTPRPMFLGDRLWIFNYPNRLQPTVGQHTQQWAKSLNHLANVPHNPFLDRQIKKPEMPFLLPSQYPNERFLNVERNVTAVKVHQSRLVSLPREVHSNVATAQRSLDWYKNNILSGGAPGPAGEPSVDHLRRLEENFSI